MSAHYVSQTQNINYLFLNFEIWISSTWLYSIITLKYYIETSCCIEKSFLYSKYTVCNATIILNRRHSKYIYFNRSAFLIL
jgi:hypothetical protein